MSNDPAYKNHAGDSNTGMDFLLSLIATALSGLILFAFLSFRLQGDLPETLLTLAGSLTVPDKNFFQVKNILGLNALFYVYLTLTIAGGLACLFKSLSQKKTRPGTWNSQILYNVGFAFVS